MIKSGINIPGINHNNTGNFLLIAGPCVVEGEDMVYGIAEYLTRLSDKYRVPYVFKASYRKANRSKADSFSGIGDLKALKILSEVRKKFSIPVITDIHNPDEAERAAEYVDVLQIPAFLCRQTDLLVAAAKSGKWVNIKKGQFLSGASMKFAVEKVMDSGNKNVMVTDQQHIWIPGPVVDFRNIPVCRRLAFR
jgi:2-dehydro-3-deoxyphosphooctonate aldolase (KDO 8-P synthase)